MSYLLKCMWMLVSNHINIFSFKIRESGEPNLLASRESSAFLCCHQQ